MFRKRRADTVGAVVMGRELRLGGLPSLEKYSFARTLLHLAGHIAGGALLFLFLALVPWALGGAVHVINGVHPFHPTIKTIIDGVELVLFGADVLLSGYVVFIGSARFVRELWRG